jgi:hypothetical protein
MSANRLRDADVDHRRTLLLGKIGEIRQAARLRLGQANSKQEGKKPPGCSSLTASLLIVDHA